MNRLIMTCKGIQSSPSHHANRFSSAWAGSFPPEGNLKRQLLPQQDGIPGNGGEMGNKWESLTKTAFNIKTTQDMLGLTCRDFSLLFTGTSPDCWNRQTIFNLCLIGLAPLMRVMHIYHEWTTPAHPPNTVACRPHMPKHPFMLTTQKKNIYIISILTFFFYPFPALSLHKFNIVAKHSRKS